MKLYGFYLIIYLFAVFIQTVLFTWIWI